MSGTNSVIQNDFGFTEKFIKPKEFADAGTSPLNLSFQKEEEKMAKKEEKVELRTKEIMEARLTLQNSDKKLKMIVSLAEGTINCNLLIIGYINTINAPQPKGATKSSTRVNQFKDKTPQPIDPETSAKIGEFFMNVANEEIKVKTNQCLYEFN